jgi:hypothetical protein
VVDSLKEFALLLPRQMNNLLRILDEVPLGGLVLVLEPLGGLMLPLGGRFLPLVGLCNFPPGLVSFHGNLDGPSPWRECQVWFPFSDFSDHPFRQI